MLAGLAASTTAGAQTWELEQGQLKLIECYGKQDGIYCDFAYTLTKAQTANVSFASVGLKTYLQDGTAYYSDGVSVMNQNLAKGQYATESADIIYGAPIKIHWYFNLPNSTLSFRALEINDIRLENVPIRATAGSTPPVAVAMPNAVNVKGFSIALSNCLLKGQDYTCTATLTPNK